MAGSQTSAIEKRTLVHTQYHETAKGEMMYQAPAYRKKRGVKFHYIRPQEWRNPHRGRTTLCNHILYPEEAEELLLSSHSKWKDIPVEDRCKACHGFENDKRATHQGPLQS